MMRAIVQYILAFYVLRKWLIMWEKENKNEDNSLRHFGAGAFKILNNGNHTRKLKGLVLQ